MKKHLIIILLSIATALSAAAKAGDRFEWNPYPDREGFILVMEVISDEAKTLKVTEIYPSGINTKLNYIFSPGTDYTKIAAKQAPFPDIYNDYHVIEICDKAFFNPDLGKDVSHIYIYDVPIIGNYAFFGSYRRNLPNQPPGLSWLELRNVKSIGEYAFSNSEIENLYINCMTPPAAHINTFSDITYSRCELHIPYGTWTVYDEHPVWGKFQHKHTCFNDVDEIETKDMSYRVSGTQIAINGVADGTVINLFDLTGRCSDSIEYHSESNNTLIAPNAGIYILHYNGKTHKILIKP